ncbi:MAG: DUF1127 domain-containing protein [Alphaproteobacteria bacterium]|nr:MAG: DUF1127 domain-containing protein [Alphaproteobacteria bacterium]
MAMIDVAPQDGWYLALAPFAGWPEAQSRPLGALRRLAARFLARRAQRETVRALNSVDPATLRDLGITDVESVVYGAPEGHKRRYDPDWWKRRA